MELAPSIWIMMTNRGGTLANRLVARSFRSKVETNSGSGVKTLSGYGGLGFLG